MSLPGSLQISPQARDISFKLQDSCNCCRPQRPSRMYVNSNGQLEHFKVRKANGSPEQAFERSLKHLNATMERKIESFDGDPDVFARKVDRVFQSIETLGEINRSHIDKINELMLEYFNDNAKGVNHVMFADEIKPPSLVVVDPEREGGKCLIL